MSFIVGDSAIMLENLQSILSDIFGVTGIGMPAKLKNATRYQGHGVDRAAPTSFIDCCKRAGANRAFQLKRGFARPYGNVYRGSLGQQV